MIIGKLSDTQSVERLHPLFREAFEWLRANAATAHDLALAYDWGVGIFAVS